MKKILLILGLSIIAYCLPVALYAKDGFAVHNFSSNLNINSDGILAVTETISIEFFEERHGIYRDLPLKYEKDDGSIHYTDLRILGVTNGRQNIPYEVLRDDNGLRIKIGDPDRLISGPYTYVIKYAVAGVLLSTENHDELYWNVTGSGWEAPLENVKAELAIDGTGIMAARCYNGFTGSNEACVSTIESNGARFESKRSLGLGEGLTLVAEYPSGIIPVLTVSKPAPAPTLDLWPGIIVAVIITLIAAAIMMRIWWQKGRDYFYKRKSLHDTNQSVISRPIFGAHEPIVPEYDPPMKLRPGEMGVLLDEKVHSVDISATIVDLAIRGYLTITEIEAKNIFGKKDYRLERSEKSDKDLLDYEQDLLLAIFGSKKEKLLSALKNKIYKTLPSIKAKLYDSVTQKGLFIESPSKVREHYGGIASGLMIAGFTFFMILIRELEGSTSFWYALFGGLAAGIFSAGLLVGLTALIMPRRSALGREVFRQVLGYKLFVSGTEKYRQPFFEKENIFMEVLPYAMVFGVTKKLSKAMQEMQIVPAVPSWYIGNGYLNTIIFTNSLNDFSSAFSSSLAPAPSTGGSGGGGFSGGGFGGGGGGSW